MIMEDQKERTLVFVWWQTLEAITEDCLMSTRWKKQWFFDNGCFKHMMWNMSKFLDINQKDGWVVTFGDNNQAQIKGNWKIGKPNSS